MTGEKDRSQVIGLPIQKESKGNLWPTFRPNVSICKCLGLFLYSKTMTCYL